MNIPGYDIQLINDHVCIIIIHLVAWFNAFTYFMFASVPAVDLFVFFQCLKSSGFCNILNSQPLIFRWSQIRN